MVYLCVVQQNKKQMSRKVNVCLMAALLATGSLWANEADSLNVAGEKPAKKTAEHGRK